MINRMEWDMKYKLMVQSIEGHLWREERMGRVFLL